MRFRMTLMSVKTVSAMQVLLSIKESWKMMEAYPDTSERGEIVPANCPSSQHTKFTIGQVAVPN